MIEAYHVPDASSKILSVRLLLMNLEITFTRSLRPYIACLIMSKGYKDIIGEYPEKD